MQLDFAAFLVIAAFVTGCIWLLDAVVLAPRRARRLEQSAQTGDGGSTEHYRMPWLVDFSRSFFPVILIVLLLRSFVVEPFRIPSGSMEPTLIPGDFILVNKFDYGLRLPITHTKILSLGEPKRGDVVVFRYPENPRIAFIKRIVGLPGDHIEYRHKQLFINGKPEELESLPPSTPNVPPGYEAKLEILGKVKHRILIHPGFDGQSWDYVVPKKSYFVMGDNRDNSRDSRYWGPMPEANLIGKAFLIWMNWDCVTGGGHCGRIGRAIK